jgi:hypothetical protein
LNARALGADARRLDPVALALELLDLLGGVGLVEVVGDLLAGLPARVSR